MVTKMKTKCWNEFWACSFLVLESHKASILHPLLLFKKTEPTISGLIEFNIGTEPERYWKSWTPGKARQSKGEQCRKPLPLAELQVGAGGQCQQSSGLLLGIWTLWGKPSGGGGVMRSCALCLSNFSKQREEMKYSGFFLPPAQSPRPVLSTAPT